MTERTEQLLNKVVDDIVRKTSLEIKWNTDPFDPLHVLAKQSLDDQKGQLHLVMTQLTKNIILAFSDPATQLTMMSCSLERSR